MKLLFIGNSATYVHEIPQTLQRLASEVGYDIEIGQITPGGYELAQHADAASPHGQRVLSEIARGYDIVFLQENGNCLSTEQKRSACAEACARLIAAIRQSGARPYFYVRPPYGKDNAGYTASQQCQLFDQLFSALSDNNGGIPRVLANRAYAYAIDNLDLPLWGPDNAHTSPEGAYLIVCTFFATLFGISATCLGANGLPHHVAHTLALAADSVVLDGQKSD